MFDLKLPDHVYDVIIVGGGPAGFTAGIYTSRAGLKTLLLQGASTVSQISMTDMIENYPGVPEGMNGFDLVERFKKQAQQCGTELDSADVSGLSQIKWGTVHGWQIQAGDKTFRSLAVIVATGANWRKLGVPGEEAFLGRGVSFCATCDAPFYRNRDVVVVGGGNTAIQEAIFLTNFARRVTIVHRRNRLRASAVLQERAQKLAQQTGDKPAPLTFSWSTTIQEIKGKDNVEAVVIKNVQTGAVSEIPTDGVFLFVGLTPNTDLLKGVVSLGQNGAIQVDREMKTSQSGIFACGDCIEKSLRQVVTACGDGAVAAYSAQLYVEELKGESY